MLQFKRWIHTQIHAEEGTQKQGHGWADLWKRWKLSWHPPVSHVWVSVLSLYQVTTSAFHIPPHHLKCTHTRTHMHAHTTSHYIPKYIQTICTHTPHLTAISFLQILAEALTDKTKDWGASWKGISVWTFSPYILIELS